MTSEEYEAEEQRAMLMHKRDAFAAAALTGLLSSPHFSPGGARISAIQWEGKSIEEIGEMEVASLIPTPKDQEEYAAAIVTMANDYADLMMIARE